ncbi:MAG: carboxylating nicotinate-nucleotide diphosphorylase [Deltaproteobacteria bacterium]|nr:carboxylating nicotinate-nucleotide diphosphorylase [Deltaproteobacteria bacterium]
MKLETLVQEALQEDIGAGDVTVEALVDPELQTKAMICAKEEAVLFGMKAAAEVFRQIDPTLQFNPCRHDKAHLKAGEKAAYLQGSVTAILKGERTALNFIQHLSGIATLTRKFVDAVAGTKVKILDTRKTTPGWRELEKQAVAAGGGVNHRHGLFDAYLIKNNHIAIAGSVSQAIEKVLKIRNPKLKLEVEVRDLKELKEALTFSVDQVLLDNFTPAQVKEALAFKKKGVAFEVSGGITLQNVKDYALAGVDFISVGGLTHSAPAVDFHLVI